jgi:hypothetical protein
MWAIVSPTHLKHGNQKALTLQFIKDNRINM